MVKDAILPANVNRRQFLFKMLPAGVLFGLGCGRLFGSAATEETATVLSETHKYLADAGMTYKEVYELVFKYNFIPYMERLAQYLGRDELVELLMRAATEHYTQRGRNWAKRMEKKEFTAYFNFLRKPDRDWLHTCTHEIIEDTDNVLQVKYTECIYADIFREVNAQDIGYAAFCHGDFAIFSALDHRIKLIRTKTLMQGDDCCDHRFVWEG
ncbi:MAG: hypothetical protein AMJ70_08165 [Dehalococcoidia bacterium SG8_51_3]|uniref:L-2-amino-thiazoline-4-carboxylic acid hydrolase n=1 Tax=candidate division WOR_3 bacterium SM23_42 TaxID=1703779 RepID=A0A0S8FWX9_UNCW3|nr:MAG: hypothetical protein AMJ70_08165 [Dehalococcoidia bacterium SG8_51_3]KPK64443.1 MAG: hypothetical protein AMJ83_01645 [candidate division WOR_3 bacterium SM23_42]